MTKRASFDPSQMGWRLGRAHEPRGGELWCPWDRTCGVIGPQGSGKTLDLLTPALLSAPGAALVTLTKTDDLLLSITARGRDGRPTVVLDPFSQADGLPELIWDPIAGCVDPIVAERRAKAFIAGTIKSSTNGSPSDGAARFYTAESVKVLQCYCHAAALAGFDLDRVLEWVDRPQATSEPAEILLNHPGAALHWHGLLQGALTGDDRTVGNTTTTVHQAMSLFYQPSIRARCVPGKGRAATDIAAVILAGGTFYLLGRDDPYASASPLMTALAEHILDTALRLANSSPWGRLCPPLLACLDELPSTAPLPTLRTRMANERALGISIIYAAQTWRQLASVFGETEARAIFGLTNVLVMFGGSKDGQFNKEVSDLIGTVRVARTTWQLGHTGGRSAHGDDMLILRPEEVRQIPEKHALVVAEASKPIIAKLSRCIEGRAGEQLRSQQQEVRRQLNDCHSHTIASEARAVAAIAACREHGLDVPRDVSIAGFGNMEIAALQSPALTTIRSPIAAIGAAAGKQILARIAGEDAPPKVEFEAELVAGGTKLIKCMLNVSFDEQKARLAERLDDPTKHWKYNPGDVDSRQKWPAYMDAYAAALELCNTADAPWYVIPANKKWYRNWAVAELLRETLDGMSLSWPVADFDVEVEKKRVAES